MTFLKITILGLSRLTFLGLALHVTSTPSNASGFALYTSGATELAQCDSVVAHTEGSASNFYNPALLPELDGTQIEIGTILLKPSVDFKSDTGGTSSTKSNIFFPSTLFLSHKINDRFSAGLGVNSTFGLGTEWRDNWDGRYIATYSDLETFNINPNLAWKVSGKLTLAGGIDILLGDALLKRKMPSAIFDPALGLGPEDVNSKIKADGEGYGYNLGILYKITEDIAFGMSYRSRIKLKLDGDIEWAQVGASTISIVDTGVKVNLDLPAQLFAGISYEPSENLILEIGGKWEDWSSYKNIKLRADQAIFSGSNINIISKDWKDAYGFNAGIKYNIDPKLSISAGYLHEGNPVPSDTFEPSVPVSDRDDFSFGIQETFSKLCSEFGYVVSISFLPYHSFI